MKKLKNIPWVRKVITFFIMWPELAGIPLAFALWLISIPLMLLYDGTAGVIDIGWVQLPLIGINKTLIASGAAWLLIRLHFGREIFLYLAKTFEEEFINLNDPITCEKLKIALWLYACYFLAFVLAM